MKSSDEAEVFLMQAAAAAVAARAADEKQAFLA